MVPKDFARSNRVAGVLAEACFSPRDDCPGRIIRLFDEAVTHIDVCVFTITDDRISSAILRAHARGVRLRIISDNDKTYDAGSDIQQFHLAGVSVRVDQTPFHMHHKFAIFDSQVLVHGSYNWTRGAARDNQESIVVVNEPRLIGAFQEEFERLWSRFA
jgi:phosphatidylserine/phosphatidylglycerophosphate/cardiolipin synthase-like enzyme